MYPVPTAEDDVLDARSHSPPAVRRTVAHACVPTVSGHVWLAGAQAGLGGDTAADFYPVTHGDPGRNKILGLE